MQTKSAKGIADVAIFTIANHLMAKVFHMYTNLIFSSSIDVYIDKRIAAALFHHFVVRHCKLSAFVVTRIDDIVHILKEYLQLRLEDLVTPKDKVQ